MKKLKVGDRQGPIHYIPKLTGDDRIVMFDESHGPGEQGDVGLHRRDVLIPAHATGEFHRLVKRHCASLGIPIWKWATAAMLERLQREGVDIDHEREESLRKRTATT